MKDGSPENETKGEKSSNTIFLVKMCVLSLF